MGGVAQISENDMRYSGLQLCLSNQSAELITVAF